MNHVLIAGAHVEGVERFHRSRWVSMAVEHGVVEPLWPILGAEVQAETAFLVGGEATADTSCAGVDLMVAVLKIEQLDRDGDLGVVDVRFRHAEGKGWQRVY